MIKLLFEYNKLVMNVYKRSEINKMVMSVYKRSEILLCRKGK